MKQKLSTRNSCRKTPNGTFSTARVPFKDLLTSSKNYFIIIFLIGLATDFPTLYEIRESKGKGEKEESNIC